MGIKCWTDVWKMFLTLSELICSVEWANERSSTYNESNGKQKGPHQQLLKCCAGTSKSSESKTNVSVRAELSKKEVEEVKEVVMEEIGYAFKFAYGGERVTQCEWTGILFFVEKWEKRNVFSSGVSATHTMNRSTYSCSHTDKGAYHCMSLFEWGLIIVLENWKVAFKLKRWNRVEL